MLGSTSISNYGVEFPQLTTMVVSSQLFNPGK
jgi:hypothetical protein